METVILNPDDAAIIIGTEEVKVILPNMKDNELVLDNMVIASAIAVALTHQDERIVGIIRDFAGMV